MIKNCLLCAGNHSKTTLLYSSLCSIFKDSNFLRSDPTNHSCSNKDSTNQKISFNFLRKLSAIDVWNKKITNIIPNLLTFHWLFNLIIYFSFFMENYSLVFTCSYSQKELKNSINRHTHDAFYYDLSSTYPRHIINWPVKIPDYWSIPRNGHTRYIKEVELSIYVQIEKRLLLLNKILLPYR